MNAAQKNVARTLGVLHQSYDEQPREAVEAIPN
jgi:hypothetical protein